MTPKLTRAQREAKERNEFRAERAEVAIKAYRAIRGVDPDSLIRDLLCDLMHCCNLEGTDFDDELSSAYMNYRAEKEGES